MRTSAVARALVGQSGQQGDDMPGDDELAEEIVIDFYEPYPIEARSEEAKALYDEGTADEGNRPTIGLCQKPGDRAHRTLV